MRTISVPGVGSWDFNVYLPSGYDQSTQRYPVVYLFRGAVDEWLDRTEDGSRAGRNIQDITDTLIAQGKMRGVILIMPGFTAMAGPASETDYSFILNTLIPSIDQQYRTLPSRWFRGVDGFSLGGLHMVNLIWRNPERFSSAGMYEGTLSMFDLNQMSAAGDAYFTRLRNMQFLLHSAAVQPSNLSNNRRFDSLLTSRGINNTFDSLIFSPTSQHNWWYADEHMIRALPLHWFKFQNPIRNVQLEWKSTVPLKVSGIVHLNWSVGHTSDSLKTLIDYSSDAGVTWHTILFTSSQDSIFDWNTAPISDGTRYLLRVQVFGDTSYAIIQTSQRLTIDNPGNGAPDMVFLSPQKDEKVSGNYAIKWSAEDPEGDTLQVAILSSLDRGNSWQAIVSAVPNTGLYDWNSSSSANSPSVQLKIRCSDATATSETISQAFEVFNQRETNSTVLQVSGYADARIIVNIVNRSQITNHTYRLSFDDSSSLQKLYSIFDVTQQAYIIQNAPCIGNGSEGPVFDGIRLSIFDQSIPVNNYDSTKWTNGSSTLTSQILIPNLYYGSDVVKGVGYPSDYEIRIADKIVDTSDTFLESIPTPLYYSVWNITENHPVNVIVSEIDSDGKISCNDDIFILEKDHNGQSYLSWEIFFTGDNNTILPEPGDVFRLKTIKPIQSNDVYEFNAISTSAIPIVHLVPQQVKLEQNYPNPFNPSTTIQYGLPTRSSVRLVIYNLLGQVVNELVNIEQQAGIQSVVWNANVASGLYFYRLEATSLDNPSKRYIETKKMLLLR